MTTVVRLASTLVAVVLLVVVPTGAASAHAELTGSNPRDGQQLTSSPRQVTLTFSEPVTPIPDRFLLLDESGRRLQRPAATAEGSRVVVDISGVLDPGGYLLGWAVVSDDGHPISGGLGFGVGVGQRAPPSAPAAAGPASDDATRTLVEVLSFLTYAGIALLSGALMLTAWCLRRTRPPAVARTLGLVGGALAAVGSLLGLWAFAPYASGDGLGGLISSDLSLAEDAGVAVWMALAAAVAVTAAVFFDRLARSGPASAAVVVLLGLTQAMTGHADSSATPGFAPVSYTVHVAAMSTWVGGVVILTALIVRRDWELSRADVLRFSSLALGCVAAVIATGALQSWWLLTSVSDLWETGYGRYLLAKLALVVAILAVAMGSRRRAHADTLPALVPSIRVEGLLQLGVLAVTSVLVMTSPPQSSVAQTGPAATDVPLPNGDTASVQLFPGEAGENRLVVTVMAPDQAPLDISAIHAAMALPSEQLGPIHPRLHRRGPARFTGLVTLPIDGDWRLALSVAVSPRDTYDVEQVVPVAP